MLAILIEESMEGKGMNDTKVVRQSNIELLRIVSMFLIVIFHCAYKSDFEFESYLSIMEQDRKQFESDALPFARLPYVMLHLNLG